MGQIAAIPEQPFTPFHLDLDKLDQLELAVQFIFAYASRRPVGSPWVQTPNRSLKMSLTLNDGGTSTRVCSFMKHALLFKGEEESNHHQSLLLFLSHWHDSVTCLIREELQHVIETRELSGHVLMQYLRQFRKTGHFFKRGGGHCDFNATFPTLYDMFQKASRWIGRIDPPVDQFDVILSY